MAENKVIEITFPAKELESGVKSAAAALKGLNGILWSIGEGVKEAFAVKGFEDYKDTVTRFGKELADALLTLELSLGRMKYALAEAVSPIASLFVPMLNSAIQTVIRFSGVVNQFLRGILAGVTGNRDLAAATKEATRSEEKLGTAAKAAGKAVRRSLAGFDELNRLTKASGSGSSANSAAADLWGGFSQDAISPQVQAVVDKILQLLEPLRQIDLRPLQTALQSLGAAFSGLAEIAGEVMEGLWYGVLTPFAAWIMQTLAPALVQGWAAKLEMIRAAMVPVTEGLKLLWNALQPVVNLIGESMVAAVQFCTQQFEVLTEVFRQKYSVIVGIFQNLAQTASQIWTMLTPVVTALKKHFDEVAGAVSQTVGAAVGYVLDMLYGLSTYLSGAFSGNWKKAWEGIRLFLKSAVNGVITLLNSMISRLASALNAVVRTANKLSFTVPAWVPAFGGRRFGVNLPYVSAPQIPYLAKGAVLPAGKPFLAMVGDQTHGTNIEAPLSTIQDAVALVMEDQTGAILRGFEASIGVQQEILQAVLGIHIGDEVIGQAVSRYQRKMAVVRGG